MLRGMYKNSPSLFDRPAAAPAARDASSERLGLQPGQKIGPSDAALREAYPNSPGLFEPPSVDTAQEVALREAYPNSPGLFAREPPAATPTPDAAKEASETGESAAPPADFKLPDGIDPNDTGLAEFRKLAGESGLAGERATKLLEMHRAGVHTTLRNAQARAEAQWERALLADPELGGGNFDANRRFAADVARRYGSDSLADAIAQAKAMHPDWFRLLVRLGRAAEGRD
jgi:hypothetical protein